MGYSWTKQTNFPNNYPQNPNQPGVEDRTLWSFKATASYDVGHGIRISPVLRHQSGLNFARTGTIVAPSGLFVTGTAFYVEPMDANREDNIWVVDTRVEKSLSMGKTKIRAGLDFFNIGNSHASETINRATGTTYLKPSAILAPFTMRIGFRFIF